MNEENMDMNHNVSHEDTGIDDLVIDNYIEWVNLIRELSRKEVELLKLNNEFKEKEFKIKYVDDIDFKELYGRANDDTRDFHVKTTLSELIDKKNELELSIDYLKRRISFLRQLVTTKTALLEVKK